MVVPNAFLGPISHFWCVHVMSVQGNLTSEKASRAMFDHVTSRWGARILMGLQDGTHRFNELRRLIGGVSDKMLSQTLQVLEEDGLVDRSVSPHSPPRVEYALSPMGREVALHLKTLTDWIEANADRADREKRTRVVTSR